MRDLGDYYQAVGFFRASGLNEAQAHHRADEAMEVPMSTFNVVLIRRSAMTIAFQTDSLNEAYRKAAETLNSWSNKSYDPIQKVLMSDPSNPDLLEYTPEKVVELATTRH